jgi:hypothetical protein
MDSAPPVTVWGIISDFLVNDPTPQEIIDFRFPPELEARAHNLLDRNGEGLLTPAERDEMFDFSRADTLMSLLKAKIRLKLRRKAS